MTRLTVLMPTIGRPTLPRQLQALAEQEWEAGDELLLVSDDNHDWCQQAFRASGIRGRHLATMDGPLGDWGHTQRNWLTPCALGDYVWHVDDDDIALPGALTKIRTTIAAQPDAFHLFRFDGGDGNLYWDRPDACGLCGTPCLVHPARIELGAWGSYYGGDQTFVRETLALNAQRQVFWHDEVIYARIDARHEALRLDECFVQVAPRLRGSRPGWRLVPGKRDWVDLRQQGGADGRGDCQAGWHHWAAERFRGLDVLDVGSGLGVARQRFAGKARLFVTQDPGPGLDVDLHEPVEQLAAKSFDVVTCFDALEHVENDYDFLLALLRVARRWVFITTPNWFVSRAANWAHVREYTPSQLAGLLGPLGAVAFWSGDSSGQAPQEVNVSQFVLSRAPHLAVLLKAGSHET